MRFSLWFVLIAVAFVLVGCDDVSVRHALEIHCVTGFDDNKLCLKPENVGSEIEVRVNVAAQRVQITILKNDGNWFIKDFILDHCAVVDAANWKCTETTGSPNELIYSVRESGACCMTASTRRSLAASLLISTHRAFRV